MEAEATSLVSSTPVAATANDDISILEAYFAQDDVRADVQEIEAAIAASTSGHAWQEQLQLLASYQVRGSMIKAAITNAQFDVLKWFFSPASAAMMGATLALMFPQIAMEAIQASDWGIEVLELMLTSCVFTHFFTPQQKLHTLNCVLAVLGRGVSDDVLSLLFSHGAQVDYQGGGFAMEPLTCFASPRRDVRHIELLHQHGAFTVGSKALSSASYRQNPVVARRLLELGAMWRGNGSGQTLLIAATNGNTNAVKMQLEIGFADVDVRNPYNQTPLMLVAANTAPTERPEDRAITTAYLLNYGASTVINDTFGKTALGYARRNSYRTLEVLLLCALSNPLRDTTIQDIDGDGEGAARDPEDDIAYRLTGDPTRAQMLRRLVAHGAGPFPDGVGGHSAYRALRATDNGSGYAMEHATYSLKVVYGNVDASTVGQDILIRGPTP